MSRKKAAPKQPEAVQRFHQSLKAGDDWCDALLEAIACWETPEEVVKGRRYQYLIGGEAFDWLLLAERLCDTANGEIPCAEREALLFFSRPPRALDDAEFKRAIGDGKHRAHLNFLYGVAVEEALQLTAEEEVLKTWRSRGGGNHGEELEHQVFERLYGRSDDELLAMFREERSLPAGDKISYSDLRAFTYWLFKYRVNQSDPARVASDTRKALAQVSELEIASRRRAKYLSSPGVDPATIVEGEVVAHVR